MNRREFSAQMLTAGAGISLLGASGVARAQGGPIEGTHYVKLSQPVPMAASDKVEVVEFFSYGCPHCNAFEPTLEAWTKTLPPYVNFHRIPVPFLANYENFQKIYYALEAMGQVEALQKKVFAAVHVERQRLDKPADISALMTKNGIDGAKFMDVFNSFAIQSKLRQARQLTDAYKIDGVPAIGVQGRYYTSVSLAGAPDKALAVTNFLIEKSRKAA